MQLHVITSKQRPRKLTIHGSDGAEYMFLLKVGQCEAVWIRVGVEGAALLGWVVQRRASGWGGHASV